MRLSLEPLDERVVPASFTFDLGGVYATATFTLPLDEVDPGEATQALELDDLTVMIDGQVADADDFSGTPTANYAFGNFQGLGVTIVDSIPAQFTSVGIANSTATGYYGSPPYTTTAVLYDLADTQATFTLPDGRAGAISYEVPWGDVDPEEANQSLPLSNFALSMAGQVITESTADFTTSPTVEFEYGVLTGITFAIDTSTIFGFPYSSISASGWTLSAVDALTSTTLITLLAGTGTVTLDFNTVKGTNGFGSIDAGTITITVKTQGNQTYTTTANFTAGISPEGLADLIASDLVQQGLASAKAAGTRVTFNGPANDPIASVKVTITNNSKPAGGTAGGQINLIIESR